MAQSIGWCSAGNGVGQHPNRSENFKKKSSKKKKKKKKKKRINPKEFHILQDGCIIDMLLFWFVVFNGIIDGVLEEGDCRSVRRVGLLGNTGDVAFEGNF